MAVLQRMTVPGAQWVPARSPITTDDLGRLRWTIPAGYGRTVRFAYKANLANAEFQSVNDIVLRVRSKKRFRVNRRYFLNGQSVVFQRPTGVSAGAENRVLLDLQARVGRGWQTFKTTRSSSRGRWKARYRFHATTGSQRYSFRVRIRQDSGFSYLASCSS